MLLNYFIILLENLTVMKLLEWKLLAYRIDKSDYEGSIRQKRDSTLYHFQQFPLGLIN